MPIEKDRPHIRPDGKSDARETGIALNYALQRIASLDPVDARLAAIEAALVVLQSEIDLLNGQLVALNGVLVAHDARLTALEAYNVAHP